MTEKSLYSALADSVGPMAKLPNNGASYHTGEQIITHLNRVLGPENWSFRILEIGEEEDSDECFCFGEITANVGGVVVVKQDYGSQAFKRARSTGKFVSKWDDKKAAATDALKRCARLLGVGLDAWANERAPSWQPDVRASSEAEYMEAATQAIDLEHPHSERLRTTKPADLDDATLDKATRQLRKWLAEKQAA